MKSSAVRIIMLWLVTVGCAISGDRVIYPAGDGPGKGKSIVFLSGDDEYRSEEALPMLAKILAARHGFRCTVLFPIGADGAIDPATKDNIPGIETLDTADLCVMLLRFRELPDAQMKHFVDYVDAGKPIIALRTSTHAFNYTKNLSSPYRQYDYRSQEWPGGFGRQVLGETWVNHHGVHGKQSTRGIINRDSANHPVLRGVTDIWGPTDVYIVTSLPKDAEVLVWGQVLAGMGRSDPPLAGPKNDPMMPLVWLRNTTGKQGRALKIVTTTMGAAVDLENEGLRRLLVNACYWALGLGDRIPLRSNVEYVGEYQPSWFGFGKFQKGIKPEDLELK